MSVHKPNLKRERKSKKELLKCSTFSESHFAQEYFHCQDNLMAFPEHGKFTGTSMCNMLNFSLGNQFSPTVKPRNHRKGPRNTKMTTRVI